MGCVRTAPRISRITAMVLDQGLFYTRRDSSMGGVWSFPVAVQNFFLSSSHEELNISSKTIRKKFVRSSRPAFLYANPNIIIYYPTKMIRLTGSSSREEFKRSRALEPKRATHTVG